MSEKPIQNEIDAALEGVNLQEVDLPPKPGDQPGAKGKLSDGTIVGVDGDDVIVELGPRMQGVISVDEFDEPPKVGETFQFTLVGRDDDLWLLSRSEAIALAALEDLDVGSRVKAKVTGQNTGGLELKLGGLTGFLPASHVDLVRVEDLSTLLGQHLVCEVLEIDRGKKRVLLSRRNVLREERDAVMRETVGALAPGAKLTGKVKRVETFGAFVDIGGVEGLVHVSNIARERVEDASEVLKVGQDVQVMVLDIKEGGRRIGLGMKQLLPDPWDDAQYRYRPDQVVDAKVVRAMDFGWFMELEPGLEGLLHVSQLGDGAPRGARKKGGPEVGESLSVRIVNVDPAQRRIGLSRLDSRGALIGSEEAAGAAEIDEVLRDSEGQQNLGTNLGNLFKKALGGDEG